MRITYSPWTRAVLHRRLVVTSVRDGRHLDYRVVAFGDNPQNLPERTGSASVRHPAEAAAILVDPPLPTHGRDDAA